MPKDLTSVAAPTEPLKRHDMLDDAKWPGAIGQVWHDCQHAGGCQRSLTLTYEDRNIVTPQESFVAALSNLAGEDRIMRSQLSVQSQHIVQVGRCGWTCYGAQGSAA
jgi:hypothetical protein